MGPSIAMRGHAWPCIAMRGHRFAGHHDSTGLKQYVLHLRAYRKRPRCTFPKDQEAAWTPPPSSALVGSIAAGSAILGSGTGGSPQTLNFDSPGAAAAAGTPGTGTSGVSSQSASAMRRGGKGGGKGKSDRATAALLAMAEAQAAIGQRMLQPAPPFCILGGEASATAKWALMGYDTVTQIAFKMGLLCEACMMKKERYSFVLPLGLNKKLGLSSDPPSY
jgi:hypothetical protein